MAVSCVRKHSWILASVDYGLTWRVALSNSELQSTKKALYNTYYSKSRDLFLIPIGSYTITTFDGIHYKKGEYVLPLARNGYIFDDLDEIWIGGPYLNVLRKGQKNMFQFSIKE